MDLSLLLTNPFFPFFSHMQRSKGVCRIFLTDFSFFPTKPNQTKPNLAINHRFWANSNPHIFQTTKMKPQRLSVWCAISSKGIFGPFFFEENLNHEVYRRILGDEFIPFAQGMDAINGWWFMQDGATAHRTRDVFELVDEHFHGRVIGLDYESRYGCGIEWPPYSPDLNPCDFWLWGYLKDKVFKTNPETLDELKRTIISVVNAIDPETFGRVIRGFESRLNALVDCNGAHFEPYIH